MAFLMNMSSSTNEHVNTAGKRIIDVEREALVVTARRGCLGDRMAIYGYSGFGREAVAFYVAKEREGPTGPLFGSASGAWAGSWRIATGRPFVMRSVDSRGRPAPCGY